VIGCEREPMHI